MLYAMHRINYLACDTLNSGRSKFRHLEFYPSWQLILLDKWGWVCLCETDKDLDSWFLWVALVHMRFMRLLKAILYQIPNTSVFHICIVLGLFHTTHANRATTHCCVFTLEPFLLCFSVTVITENYVIFNYIKTNL